MGPKNQGRSDEIAPHSSRGSQPSASILRLAGWLAGRPAEAGHLLQLAPAGASGGSIWPPVSPLPGERRFRRRAPEVAPSRPARILRRPNRVFAHDQPSGGPFRVKRSGGAHCVGRRRHRCEALARARRPPDTVTCAQREQPWRAGSGGQPQRGGLLCHVFRFSNEPGRHDMGRAPNVNKPGALCGRQRAGGRAECLFV